MKSLLAIVVLAIVLNTEIATGCRCFPLNMLPPVKDCPDYFLTILTVNKFYISGQLAYMDYTTLYDMSPRLKNHGNMNNYKTIVSHKEGAVCGRRLSAGSTYLLMGRLPGLGGEYPTISLCGTLVKELEKIPTKEEAQKMLDETFKSRCVEVIKQVTPLVN